MAQIADDPMLQSDAEVEQIKQGRPNEEEKILTFGQDDIVTVKNILDRPFRFKYESALYELEPNHTSEMPGFMAWHYLKKFADYYYRHVKNEPKKTRSRFYQKSDPLFKELIVKETKIMAPTAESRAGKVIKLDANALVDDEIKGEVQTGQGDQVLAEQKVAPERNISDEEFDKGLTDQDKAIEEANAFPDAKKPKSQKDKKK